MITVQNLTRKYGDFVAVRDVSFEIPEGQVVGLLGHNGAGKTTIMKMITGVLEPTEGTVLIDGQSIERDRLAVQTQIGFLPEVAPTYPDMTVMEYLEFVCGLREIPEEKRTERIARVVTTCGLREKALQPISTLSKGYRQRVGVAQAIIHEPRVLILDEPTSGLDPTQIEEMRGLIRSLSSSATVILSTHILQEVEAMCDRVIIVRNGEVAADSELHKLQRSNRLLVAVNQNETAVKAVFTQIPGVKGISFCSNGGASYRFTLELHSEPEQVAPVVAKAIIENGWELFQLETEQRNLEAVFREVNSRS